MRPPLRCPRWMIQLKNYLTFFLTHSLSLTHTHSQTHTHTHTHIHNSLFLTGAWFHLQWSVINAPIYFNAKSIIGEAKLLLVFQPKHKMQILSNQILNLIIFKSMNLMQKNFNSAFDGTRMQEHYKLVWLYCFTLPQYPFHQSCFSQY